MERTVIPSAWQVPGEFRRRLGYKPGRQRAMAADDHLLLVLHRPPLPDEAEREGRLFWRQPDGSWKSTAFGAGSQALPRHLDEYEAQFQKYDRMEEQATTAADYFEVINGLTPLLRSARHLHETLAEARRLCPVDDELLNCRDRAYELERNLDLLFSDARNAMEFLVARQAEQYTQSSHRMETAAHRLNLLAAFFLPIATLAALLQLEWGRVEQHWREPQLLLTVAAIGVAAGWLLTRIVSRAASPLDRSASNAERTRRERPAVGEARQRQKHAR